MFRLRHLVAVAGFASLPLVSAPALAAPCAGFVDVDDASPTFAPFCSSIEWIRNRGVTLGCTATQYCPFDNVSRLQMAAFMRRLGDALTPVILTQTVGQGAYDLDLAPTDPAAHLCQVGPYTVTGFPRRAIIHAQFSGRAAGTVQVFGSPSFLDPSDSTWKRIPPNGIGMRDTATGATWLSISQSAPLDLAVGQTYTFAILVQRDATDGGTADMTEVRCNMLVEIGSRTGAATPFDTAAGGALDNAR